MEGENGTHTQHSRRKPELAGANEITLLCDLRFRDQSQVIGCRLHVCDTSTSLQPIELKEELANDGFDL